jgi:hypothetical protein
VVRSLINLFTQPVRILARTVGLGASPTEPGRTPPPAEQTAAPLLEASADTRSAANHALHRPGEGTVPIKHYDELTAHDAVIAIQTLASSTEVRATLRHERAGKNRRTVQDAGERRLAELSPKQTEQSV